MALALGFPDPLKMLESMPASLLTEWMGFDAIEPLQRGALQLGTLTSLLANVYRNPEKRMETFGVEEFIPDWGRGESANLRQSSRMKRGEGEEERKKELYERFRTWAILSGATPKERQ